MELDLTGQKFGRWTALYKCDYKKGKDTLWHCRCDCGTERDVRTKQLRNGRSKSCGCYAREQSSKSNIIDLTNSRFGKLTVTSFSEIKNHRAFWNCVCDCGNTYIARGDLLLRGDTTSCGCARIKPVYDLVGKKFGRLTVLRYDGYSKFTCKCECGNITHVESYSLRSGHTKSCGKCDRIDNKIGNRYGKLTVVEYAGKSSCNHTLWKCRCDCGAYTVVDVCALTNGATKSCGCLHKSANFGSTDELAVKDYLQSLLPNEEIDKARILDGKEIDLFIKSKSFGIEFNGSAFHATENGAFREISKNYHRDKFLKAKSQGIHLVTIFDVDWWKNSEKIKNYLHDCLVGTSNKVYARNCTISEIDKSVAKEFCDKYHLQGASRYGSINIGLSYNNELIAVMAFGKVRLRKDCIDHYELHRYCVKYNYTIVGGASKLHKYFEKHYKPKYIRSYSDNDYFTGGIYNILGYKEIKQSNQRYYWFLHNKEYKREQCQLKFLSVTYPKLYNEALEVNASNKEDYIMQKLGARKVYRCGNTLWEKYI